MLPSPPSIHKTFYLAKQTLYLLNSNYHFSPLSSEGFLTLKHITKFKYLITFKNNKITITNTIRTQTEFFNCRMYKGTKPRNPYPQQVPIIVPPAFSLEVKMKLVIIVLFRGETSLSHQERNKSPYLPYFAVRSARLLSHWGPMSFILRSKQMKVLHGCAQKIITSVVRLLSRQHAVASDAFFLLIPTGLGYKELPKGKVLACKHYNLENLILTIYFSSYF